MRKICALFLSLTILLSAGIIPVTAKQASAAESKAEQVITALGIMNTDKGSSAETSRVTRARFAQMLINLSSLKGKVTGKCNISLFSDVSKKYWASGYIQTAVTQGWMSGYLSGKFKPTKGITLQEAVNGIVKLLGYTDNDFSGNITEGEMALYASKGLNKNIRKARTSYLTNNDCINLFYNTLNAMTKDGKVYAETLGYKLDSNKKIDYLSIISDNTVGPVIADSNWKNEIPISASAAQCYRNGKECSYSDIKDYDVLYYSKSLKTIWAYDSKVTGTVESISPDHLSPASVTVSGKSYTLGTSEMAIAFSTMGTVDEGDMVTLLLGKDNTVAGVLSIDEYNTTITGVVLETGEHFTEVENTGYVSSKYVVFVDAAGNKYQQDYDGTQVTLSEGDLVRVTYKDGKASVSKYVLETRNFGTNIFSSDTSRLGDVKLSSNVKILDLYDGQYASVYPERLAGANISNYIIYYELNASGEITQLILNNFTGDLYQYGIYKGFSAQSSDKISYEYIIDGEAGSTMVSSFSGLDNTKGPMGFIFSGKTLTKSFALTQGTVLSVDKTTVQINNSKYPLADGYDVYILLNGEYIKASLDTVSNLSRYHLTAYYDDAVSYGGRVRIIVATSLS